MERNADVTLITNAPVRAANAFWEISFANLPEPCATQAAGRMAESCTSTAELQEENAVPEDRGSF